MPKALVGSPPTPVVEVSPSGSHSDPDVPFVSIHTPLRQSLIDITTEDDDSPFPPQTPRPRPSLQIYYVAPDAGSLASVMAAAQALHTRVLVGRRQYDSGATNDRLDVYGLPGGDAQRCAEHQLGEIAARKRKGLDREWYVQRYDLGLGEGRQGWRWGFIIVQWPVEEWDSDRGTGLGVAYLEPVVGHKGRGRTATEAGSGIGDGGNRLRVVPTTNPESELVAVGDLRSEVNWEHTAWQFCDQEMS